MNPSTTNPSVPAIRRITVVADTNSPGVLPIYSGLRAYARHAGVPLSFRPWAERPIGSGGPGLLLVEVHVEGAAGPRLVCFDMHDSGQRYFREHLEQCDLYFKRSYDPADVERLPDHLARKLKPYGLFCRFADARDTSLVARVACELRARAARGFRLTPQHVSWWGLLFTSSWLRELPIPALRRKLVLPERTLRVPPGPLGETICFQTRVWGPDEARGDNDVSAINAMRADTVRALRRRFGSRFLGGLLRSPFALANYPDLVTPHSEDRESYLRLLHSCRISVITAGIHRSIPGKVAESLAAGRCIVTEPLGYELPVPLRDGTHYLLFRTPDECVAACERLLNDDGMALLMQAANRAYYEEHAAAEATLRRCLAAAAHGVPN